MTNSINSNRDFNNLIFENKNKAYGAYELRTSESNTISKSMFITFSAICILVLSAFMMNKKNMESKTGLITIDDSIYVITCFLEPPPVDIPPVIDNPLPPEKSPYSDNLNIKVEDKPVDNSLKPTDAMIFKKDGDIKGVKDSAEYVEPPKHVVELPKGPTEPIGYASEMPEMPNMSQFIADNLKYPSMAVEGGVSGKVYLSFVVEKDGSVSNVKILRGIGAGCEEEAVRVVKMMPKWKPGKNNGELVRVQFNLPVKFSLK